MARLHKGLGKYRQTIKDKTMARLHKGLGKYRQTIKDKTMARLHKGLGKYRQTIKDKTIEFVVFIQNLWKQRDAPWHVSTKRRNRETRRGTSLQKEETERRAVARLYKKKLNS
ncbi:MAG: hypothetical protein RSE13_07225 [Planktothrix sp. GU0601_MAG3]|nr:MAG: hypothetical protein RSE13_07225 [Planktothrix sp. GU0601_MAG3]